jgi:3-oxoadipate enol-lactonase
VTPAGATGIGANTRPAAASAPRRTASDAAPRGARDATASAGPPGSRRTLTRRPRSLATLLRRRRAPRLVPEPPIEPPPGRIVHAPGRGEFFLRDSGGDGPALLLLHGWMVSADLNWITVYDSLRDAGYCVLALDHRGHGRGLRTPAPFRLVDCADDAAAILRHEGIDRALAVGYSMGGPIACLLARDHADLVDGVVLCATAPDWQEPRMKRGWRLMSLVRLELGLFPNAAWRASLRALGLPDESGTTWAAAELSRGSARDIAEAGRELGRYDGRPWLARLRQPGAVIVPAEDTLVPARKQRELAALLDVAPREVPGTHVAITTHPEPFVAALLGALSDLRAPATLQGR